MIKLIALLKRKPGISREEFKRVWVDQHTRISSQMPGLLGYRVNVATLRQPTGTDIEPIYDGTAELWWNSVEEMEAGFETALGIAAGQDADKFCEIRIHIYTDEYVIVPGPNQGN